MLGIEPRVLHTSDKALGNRDTSPGQKLLFMENSLSQVKMLQMLNPHPKMVERILTLQCEWKHRGTEPVA